MPATLTDRIAELHEEATTIVNQAREQDRDITADEKAKFDQIVNDAETMKRLAAATSIADEAIDPTPEASIDRRSPGEVFAASDQIAAVRSQYPDGIPNSVEVRTGAVRVADVKAVVQDPGLGAPLHVVEAPPGVDVFDLLSQITVIPDAPSVIKHFTATLTNAANVVAEGAVKPESNITWSDVTLNQETIAHHLPISNQALSHNSMLRGYVDNFLVAGVRSKVQANVAAGLSAWSGLAVRAFDTDLRTTLRKAITIAQRNGALIGAGSPGIAMSLEDAETLDLEQLQNLVLQPGQAPQQTGGIWRTPLFVSAALPTGVAYVGDLKQVVFYGSTGVSVSTGWVNDQFIKNQQTILGETEGVTGVLGAGAIVKTALAPAA